MMSGPPLSITPPDVRAQPSTDRTWENPADPRTPRYADVHDGAHTQAQAQPHHQPQPQPQPMSVDAMTRSSFAQSLNLPHVNKLSKAYTKKKLLWDAWNELEWKDEFDGQKAYETYSQLKQRYGEKHPAPADLRPPSMVRQFSQERQRTTLMRHASAPPPLFNYPTNTNTNTSSNINTNTSGPSTPLQPPVISGSLSAPLPSTASLSSPSQSTSPMNSSPTRSPAPSSNSSDSSSSSPSLLPPTMAPVWRQHSAPLPSDPAQALMMLTTTDDTVVSHTRQRRESAMGPGPGPGPKHHDTSSAMEDDFNEWEYYDDSDDEDEDVPEPMTTTTSTTTTLPVETDDQHPFGPPPTAPNSSQPPLIGKAKSNLIELTDDHVFTMDFLTQMMDEFRMHIPASFNNAFQILKRVLPILTSSPNLIYLTIHPHCKLTIVGDLHGQLEDLLTIFKLNGLPSDRNQYLFNGDFVDRGQHSCEIVLTLMAWKLVMPSAIHFNRGNHESADINSRDGFEKECLQKYDSDMYDLFGEVFAALPLAHVVGNKVFVVHGGLCQYDIRLSDIAAAYRFSVIPPKHSIIEDLLWSDPTNKQGRHPNSRGCALEFGVDVVRRFLSDNNLSYVIRSHECVDDGYEKWFDGLLYTVFSASNYCGVVGNAGAVMLLESNLEPQPVVYMARNKNVRKSTRLGRLHDEVMRRLIVRIISNRLGLINFYVTISRDGLVSRRQWADGLRIVLELNIPFLKFQSFLGLPKLGAKGQPGGDIDYMDFLSRFRPQPRSAPIKAHSATTANDPKTVILNTKSSYLSMNASNYPTPHVSSPTSTSTSTTPTRVTPPVLSDDDVKLVAEINEMLFAKRYELEALFRFFDHHGDGCISSMEFRDGLQSLTEVLGRKKFMDTQLDRIVAILDPDGDGTIAYSEFFQSFRPVDPVLAARLHPHNQHAAPAAAATATATATVTATAPAIATATSNHLTPSDSHTHTDTHPGMKNMSTST